MKKYFYIDYPQEHLENKLHNYRCAYCKVETTVINGRLEGHLSSCEYRMQLQRAGYEVGKQSSQALSLISDDVD